MKPPKSWLAEYANNHGNGNDKPNKDKNGSFGSTTDNSFRNYMARKITLQRDQFGLVLPPPPEEEAARETGVGVQDEKVDRVNFQSPEGNSNLKNVHKSRTRVKKIRFNLSDDSPAKAKSKVHSKDSESEHRVLSQEMDGVLSRLKKKHKRGSSRSRLSSLRRSRSRGSSRRRKRHCSEYDHTGIDSQYSAASSSVGSDLLESESPLPKQNFNTSSSNEIQIEDEKVRKDPNHNPLTTSSVQSQSQFPSQTPSPSSNSSFLQLKRQRKDLFFLGVVCLVNGYTDPGVDTIMRMLHKHGGNLEKYETECVTHIIAESLSTAKSKIYKKQKRPVPVVKPQWIVDCVNSGSLLPHADYLLEKVRDEHVCRSVKSFFKRDKEIVTESDAYVPCGGVEDCIVSEENPTKSPPDGDGRDIFTLYQQLNDSESSPSMDGDSSRCSPSKSGSFVYNAQPASPMYPSTQASPSGSIHSNESTPIRLTSRFAIATDTKNIRTKEKQKFEIKAPEDLESSLSAKMSPPPRRPANVKNNTNAHAKEKKSSPSKQPKHFPGGMRTVGTDPDFLESYFSSSRLSFIGSFKQRLEKSNVRHGQAARGADSKRFVLHVDMDCFFAAIAVRNFPQFREQPVAVGHAWKNDLNGVRDNPARVSATDEKKKSYSELSTCNYKARSFGVKKGMFLHRARQLCPDLVVLPYDYEGYEDASNKVGEILRTVVDEYSGAIEQVSCDESYLEFYLDDVKTPENDIQTANDLVRSIGESIRKGIVDETKCTASIGIGPNKLLAKLATNNAKDSGGDKVAVASHYKTFLKGAHLRKIPGVGYRMEQKLQHHNLTHVHHVWDISEGELTNILGPGNGSKIYRFCHGEDDRPVKPAERKTIGAECNYGVRFDGPYGVDHMMMGLAVEVEKRMSNVRVLGKHITVKVKERRAGAGPPGKFNGHGKCNDHSKSSTLPGHYPTRDATVIATEAMKLFEEINIDKDEIRGMGIVISKLDNEGENKDEIIKSSRIASWLQSSIATNERQHEHIEKERNTGRIDEIQPCSSRSEIEHTDFVDLDGEKRDADSMKSRNNITNEMKAKRSAPKHSATFSNRSQNMGELQSFFKLAEIKSGEKTLSYDGEQVSLTQLDSLPIEIQLQVASGGGPTEQNIWRPSTKVPIPSTSSRIIDNGFDRNEENGTQSFFSEITVLDDDDDEVEEEQPQDVTVLRNWMDEHENPSNEDVELVRDFICICVSEKRLDDVVAFLRLINIRHDSWKIEHYQSLLQATEQSIFNFHGKQLDLSGLGLL